MGMGQAPDADGHALVLTSMQALPAEVVRGLPPRALVLHHRTKPGLGVTWRGLACVPVASPAEAEELIETVAANGVDLHRAVLGRVQRGLDMWVPRHARPAIAIYEYVSIRPEAREAYHQSQHEVSGPAMRALWQRGHVQRFVGIEALRDLTSADRADSGWDVLHVTSVAVASLPRMLGWSTQFDSYARAAGYASMRALQAEWSTQRTLRKGTARMSKVG